MTATAMVVRTEKGEEVGWSSLSDSHGNGSRDGKRRGGGGSLSDGDGMVVAMGEERREAEA